MIDNTIVAFFKWLFDGYFWAALAFVLIYSIITKGIQ